MAAVTLVTLVEKVSANFERLPYFHCTEGENVNVHQLKEENLVDSERSPASRFKRANLAAVAERRPRERVAPPPPAVRPRAERSAAPEL